MAPFQQTSLGESPARILLVDDDPVLREFACVTLATPDVLLDTAAGGEEALLRLATAGADLVLVGSAIADMKGCAFIAKLRATPGLESTPAVVITEGGDTANIDAAFEAGATSFIVKPLNATLFLHQLRYVLRASRQEMEVRQAHAHAAQALAVKANVLRLVQHELRTPLTSIIGFAEHIEAHPGARNVAEFARFIAVSGRRFSAQIDDLVAAAQILTADIALNMDECRVGPLLHAVVQSEAQDTQNVRVRDATGDAQLVCDRDLLARALRGLLRNALQHGAGPVDLVATRERETIVFAVRDHGSGIPQSSMEASFEPFQQSHDALARDAQGLGLGLPVARRIVEAHGGALRVSMIEGAGFVALATVPTPPPTRYAA